jgi:hypothetical protein
MPEFRLFFLGGRAAGQLGDINRSTRAKARQKEVILGGISADDAHFSAIHIYYHLLFEMFHYVMMCH